MPDVPLLGTTWYFRSRVVNELVGMDQPADPDAWVRFAPGTVTFHRTVERSVAPQDLVCPSWTARVALAGDQVSLVDPESDPESRHGCGTRFLGYGSRPAVVGVSGRELTVRTADGSNAQTMVFSADRPVPPAAGTPDLAFLPAASTPTVRQQIEANPLRGKHFRAVSGPGLRLVGPGVTLDFANDVVMVSTGCNGISAGYAVTGSQVSFTDGASTLVGCDAARSAQENWAHEVISEDRSFTFDGTTFRLTVPGGQAVFTISGPGTTGPSGEDGFSGKIDEIVDATGHRRLPALEPGEFIGEVRLAVSARRLVFDAGCGQQVSALDGTLPRVTADVADGPVLQGCPPLRTQLMRALRSILSGPLTVEQDDAGFVTVTGRDGLQVTAHSGFIPG